MAKIALFSLMLVTLGCGVNMDSGPQEGPVNPEGVYEKKAAMFVEQCQDGSSRVARPGPLIDFEVEAEAADRAFSLSVSVIHTTDGSILESEAWGGIIVTEDGAFDTGDRMRAARLSGRFTRADDGTDALAMLVIAVANGAGVPCVRTYDFSR